jgi:hypothetical protein
MLATLILAASITSVASAQDCQPVSAERVTSTMQQALMDFATLDEESFRSSVQQTRASLPCLDEIFLPPNAAAYHRLMGLEAFFDGESERVVVEFRAAQQIEPGFTLSAKLAPEGGKLHRLWVQAQQAPEATSEPFQAPAGKYAWVGGAEGRLHASELPSIVQYGDGDGSVSWTGYLAPGEVPPSTMPGVGLAVAQPEPEPEPEIAAEPASTVATAPIPEPVVDRDDWNADPRDLAHAPAPEKTKGDGRGGLIAATVVSGVMTGGLAGGASFMHSEYRRYPTRENYVVSNGALYGAIGMGAATVTFGSLAVLTSKR